jgi:hypothetical protein
MEIYLFVDGSLIAPESAKAGQAVFRLTLPVTEIRLISGYARPVDIHDSQDHRRLGVALYDLCWQQNQASIRVGVDSPSFIDGFYHVEWDETDATPFRWTNGDAALPSALVPPWRGETLLHLNLRGWAGSAIQRPPRPDAAVLSAFESLGENCELALAQRHFGVELPLSLMRWSGTTYEKLLRGLESRFQGLGEPETTQAVWDTTDYRLLTPYLNMHTTTIKQRDDSEVAEILSCGRATLSLLRRKLLKDIADARRIFVFRTADPHFGPIHMPRLHAALRAIGSAASLLCVTVKRQNHSGPDLLRLADGLYAGYLDRFVIPDGPFDEWFDLLARTLSLHQNYETRAHRT